MDGAAGAAVSDGADVLDGADGADCADGARTAAWQHATSCGTNCAGLLRGLVKGGPFAGRATERTGSHVDQAEFLEGGATAPLLQFAGCSPCATIHLL